MFLVDPPPHQADLHFRIFGFPVRVHPFFWLLPIALGIRSIQDPKLMVIWVGIVFFSILVHELGHAFAMRYYGGHARIVLYVFGGMAIPTNVRRTPLQYIMICFAGPLAGFMLLGFLLAIVHALGHNVSFWQSPESPAPISFFFFNLYYIPFTSDVANTFIDLMVFVNFFWGVFNLLPIFPLDGGQISRELFILWSPWSGAIRALEFSMATCICLAVVVLYLWNSVFGAIYLGYFAYSNWKLLESHRGRF